MKTFSDLSFNSSYVNEPWAALFDLDGVLIDSEGIYTDFWHRIDERYPTGVDKFEYVIKGSTLNSILSTYFPDARVRSLVVDELKEHERNMDYVLFDGAESLLISLRTSGIKTAIVTSSNLAKMKHLFSKLPCLEELVDVVITEEDVSLSKPHPQGYNLAALRLGVSPCRCIVFEDSLAGVEAGRRAGGAVVGVATTNPANLLEEFADVIVNTVAEVDIDCLPALLANAELSARY